MCEYMVHIWGGAWNKNANPSIEHELGIKEGYHYFATENEKDNFLAIINSPTYQSQGIMYTCTYGEMTHKRTVFVGIFIYNENEYVLRYDFGYEYQAESAIFIFTEGNYSCDCNRSMFINEEYGEETIPYLGCGFTIMLKDYQIEYHD